MGESEWDESMPPVRALLLCMFLTGNVVFIGYRASLTSNLSVRSLALPFNDLQTLLESDFKYVMA